MTITLAPMEGVVDVHMRDMMTRISGFDLCVTEFVRVSQVVAPREWFLKYCPELETGGKTQAGTDVHVQLMGGEAHVMADNAAFAVHELGAPGIDLNFGCPAKTVNRHMAGAALLQWPEKLFEITSAVKAALSVEVPFSAKMRLGFEDKSLALENARALVEAGAQKLTVHARTKLEGYKAPAHWEWIARIKEVVDVPVVANGEIWTPDDARMCRDISGCADIMIGRGAIARPSLAREIKGGDFAEWPEVLGWLVTYCDMMLDTKRAKWGEGRMKQWIKLLSRTYPQAKLLFDQIKRVKDPYAIHGVIMNEARDVADVA
ncbi:MAG: tRNA-dihydrouridine synthase family protein [Methylocystaceae bacterium]|nr:tRNA-dihydrouridine synthase family protein [Methylocystaceae bacterium]